nr:hypothetical protein Iba_chr13aCG9690 [Ipomoea batatas]
MSVRLRFRLDLFRRSSGPFANSGVGSADLSSGGDIFLRSVMASAREKRRRWRCCFPAFRRPLFRRCASDSAFLSLLLRVFLSCEAAACITAYDD